MSITSTDRRLAWTSLVVAAVINVAGYVWNLYDALPWFDEVIHGYTIFAMTLPIALLLYGVVLTGGRQYRLLLVLTIASIGLAIGALWEVAEWGYDQFTPTDDILGKTDTIIDLVMDTIGAVVAGIFCVAMANREP